MAPFLKEFRKTWVPLLKTFSSSAADVYGDYMFYKSIGSMDAEIVEKYQLPTFIFFIVACVMFGLTTFTLLCKGFAPKRKVKSDDDAKIEMSGFERLMRHLYKRANQILFLEMILEDIPQFVLSTLVTYALNRQVTPSMVLNVTTSAYNFVFNIFDILTPDEEEEEDKGPMGEPLSATVL